MENTSENPNPNKELSSNQNPNDFISDMEANAGLQKVLCPLIAEFFLLRESVNTVHADYADLKQTISKHKDDVKQELSNKIKSNTIQLNIIAEENKQLKKENDLLKDRLTKIKQNQLGNNVIITRIQEGPFEPYYTTKL